MCGICGIVSTNGERIEVAHVIAARDSITHRGPDAEGLHVEPLVCLASRRLSIIDIAHGHQPLANETDSIWIAFNGEIYNYRALRARLEAAGHRFRTSSDTEVIVHLYEEHGVDCVKELHGMFAFAIWDRAERRLFAARDRLGEKPFYYHQAAHRFAFASEIKALLEFPWVPRRLHRPGVAEYLRFGYVSDPDTLFDDIHTLPPGHILVFENGIVTVRPYWDPLALLPVESPRALDELEAEYHELIRASVGERLMSEVPLGTFNSGGVDSSLITALTAEECAFRLNSFSVGMDVPGYDERIYARMVAKRNDTIHHELSVTSVAFADALPHALWLHDEPLNHPNSVFLYLLSRLAKQFVTVVLTGEGADEVFGGYPRYLLLKYLTGAPGRLLARHRHLLSFMLERVPTRRSRMVREAINLPFDAAVIENSARLSQGSVKGLLREEFQRRCFPERERFLVAARSETPTRKILYHEMKTHLVSVLNRADKMSMGASVEGRVPFLDHRCVEFAYRLPSRYQLRGSTTKYFLKRYSARYLPREIVHRQKSGFGAPLGEWLRESQGLGRYLSLLEGSRLDSDPILNATAVNELVRAHLTRRADHGQTLWSLINLEMWREAFRVGD